MNSAWFFFLNPICRNSDEVCGFWRYMRYRSIMIQRLHYPRLVWYWEDDAFDSVESSDISNVRDVQPNEVHYVHRSPWGLDQLQPKQRNQLARLLIKSSLKNEIPFIDQPLHAYNHFMSKTNFLIGKSRVCKITILAWGLESPILRIFGLWVWILCVTLGFWRKIQSFLQFLSKIPRTHDFCEN